MNQLQWLTHISIIVTVFWLVYLYINRKNKVYLLFIWIMTLLFLWVIMSEPLAWLHALILCSFLIAFRVTKHVWWVLLSILQAVLLFVTIFQIEEIILGMDFSIAYVLVPRIIVPIVFIFFLYKAIMSSVDGRTTVERKIDHLLKKAKNSTDSEQKINLYSKAVHMQSENDRLYALRGNEYLTLGYYKESVKDFLKAIELNPDQSVYYYKLGDTYLEQQDYQSAVQSYDQCLNLNPENKHAYTKRGDAYYELGDNELAIQSYTQAIKIDPDFTMPYYNRGNVHARMKQYEKAIADYNKVIHLNPLFVSAIGNRGNIYSELGEHEKAIQDLNQVIKIDKTEILGYLNLGAIYFDQGEYKKAIHYFTDAIRLSSNNTKGYYYRGISYLKLNCYEDSIHDIEEAIKIDPDFEKGYAALAEIFADQRKDDLMYSYLEKALELGFPVEELLDSSSLERYHDENYFKGLVEKYEGTSETKD